MKKAKFRSKFYKNYFFKLIPSFKKETLRWKDKFNTPRCESEPNFRIEWLWFGFYGAWGDDQYWEQWLWVNEYHNGDIETAKKEWGWVDYDTKESTWIDY